jgi:adenylosuccinate synthase
MGKIAKAVIGAAYGDEGKGLMTDYLASETGAATVVRTNGGAQAGHSVTTPDGRRHVFSHIGSGAFAGAATHLSKHFVIHPMFFLDEREKVAALGGETSVSADPRAPVTTPFDVMINQIVEDARGSGRHGSCGMGFGETIERSLRPDLAIAFGDLSAPRIALVSKLERIRREWIAPRLAALGVPGLPERFREIVADNRILARFLDDCEALRDLVRESPDAALSAPLVFEGAQGLMLDQEYGHFPHVTRSNTGILNMAAVAAEAGIETIEATYMTRAYTTRHGAGPLAHEGEDMAFARIVDPTNIPNDWQGAIRAAPLDLDILSAAISHDLGRAGRVRVDARIGVTCLDQIEGEATVWTGGAPARVPVPRFAEEVSRGCGIDVALVSSGPTRASVATVTPCRRPNAAIRSEECFQDG